MQTTLKRNAISFIDAIVISVAGTAPAYSLTSTTASLIAAVGMAGPAALIVAAVPMFGITLAFQYLNRWRSDAGATYAWVGRTLSPDLGFLSGWALMISNTLFLVSGSLVLGQSTLNLLASWHLISHLVQSSEAAATMVGIGWFLLVLIPLFIGISLVAKFQRAMMLFEVIAVIVIFAVAVTKLHSHPAHAFSWQWFSPAAFGSGDVFMKGMLVAAFYYWGWDVSANLSEETAQRNVAPGRGAAIGMALLFVIFLSGQVVFQYGLDDATIKANGATLLTALADAILPPPWGDLALAAVVISALAVLETSILQASRTLYSMGRDRVLGPAYAKVDPKHGAPWMATVVVGVVGLALFVTCRTSPSVNAFIQSMINAIALQVVFYYSLAGIACFALYRKTFAGNGRDLVFKGLWPLLSALFLIGVGVYFIATGAHTDVAIGLGGLLAGIVPLIISRVVYRSGFYREPRAVAVLRDGRVEFTGGGNPDGETDPAA